MNSYNYSYNVLINRLEAFAAGHFLIKRFTHGQIDMADQLQDDQYPFMHVTPDTIEPVQGAMNFGFHIMFADIPRDKEYKAEYQREVISDCIRLGQDLIAEVKNGLELFGFDVQLLETPVFEPFMEEQKNTVTGVAFTLKLSVPWDWSACDIPAIWSTGGTSGSGGSATGYGIELQTNGVDNVVQTKLNLVNGSNITITDLGNGSVTIDAATTTVDYVSTEYNANHTTATGNQYLIGDRVWYNGNVYQCIANNDAIIPTNTLYWALVAVGNRLRQTPVDWNATSGDFQVLNKPTIPAAQVNSDWNAVSGVAQILNKPTIPAAQVNSDWNAASGVAQILNKPTLATVATTGSYTDLINQPTIPAAQIQSDWTQANTSAVDFIKNKPTITTPVNADWNAVTGLAQILNKPFVPSTLDSLTDVNTPTPTNGQVLTFNTATGQWIASTPSGGGSGTVTSVALTAPSAFTISGSPITTSGTIAITANGTSADYIDGTGSVKPFPSIPKNLDDLADVSAAAPSNFNVLYYLGGVWKNGFINLDTLQDVNAPTPTNGQVLTYDSSSATWIASAPAGGSPTGAAGGDLQGTYPNPVVHQVHGIEMQSGTPTTGDVWLYEGSPAKWQHQPLPAVHVTNDSGVTGSSVKDALNHLNTTKVQSNAAITGATATKITYDSKGLVTAGTSLAAGDMPTGIDAANIGTGVVSNTEFSYLDGVTSNIQTQLNAKQSTSILYQFANGDTLAAGATRFGALFGGSANHNVSDAARRTPMITNGTLTRLYVMTSTAQPATGSLVCTVRKNSVDQALTLTIAAGSAAGVFSDLVNSVTVVVGDQMGMKFVNNATGTSAAILNNQVLLTI